MTHDIQKQGANARALGASEFDNPFYKGEQLPAYTGETTKEWERKAEAWRAGWIMEDLIRSGRAST